jgi:hypothetical protein
MGKFKEIKTANDIEEDDPDACFFSIDSNKDMTEITLRLRSNTSVTPEEYFNTLAEFLNTVSENPESIFVESPNEDDSKLH